MANDKTQHPVEKARFLEFMSLPNADARKAAGFVGSPSYQGRPGTVLAFADQYGITAKTLHQWKKQPDMKEAAAENVLDLIEVSDLQEIMTALLNQAKDGHVPSAKLIMDYAGVTAQKPPEPEDEVTPKDLSGMTIKQLKAIAELDDGDGV